MLTRHFPIAKVFGCIVAETKELLPQEVSPGGVGVGILLHWPIPGSSIRLPVLATAGFGTAAHRALWALLPGDRVDLQGDGLLIEMQRLVPPTLVLQVERLETAQATHERVAEQ